MELQTTSDVLLGSHPIEIYKACDRLFGDEPWLQWEPETLLLHLRDDVSEQAEDKLLAVQAVACNANPVTTMALAFEKTVNAFCNNVCVMDEWQAPYVEELCYAVPQIEKIIRAVHGSESKVKFDGEVPSYVAGVAKHRGWIALPKRLGFAKTILNSLNGLSENSDKYLENQKLVDEVRAVCNRLEASSVEAIFDSGEYKALSEKEQVQFAKITGALLFDPTLLYR